MIEAFKPNYPKLLNKYIYKTSKGNMKFYCKFRIKILSKSVDFEEYIIKFNIIHKRTPAIKNTKTIYDYILTINTSKDQKLKIQYKNH